MAELRAIEMPHFMRIHLSEPEAGALSKVQSNLGGLAKYARTFTAAAEMLSFSQQNAAAHEAKCVGDSSALGQERRELLSEWGTIAVRDGAMTLFHFAEMMDNIATCLHECPTLAASVDHAQLDGLKERFQLSFPGFKAIGNTTAYRADPPSTPEKDAQGSFSETLSEEHIRIHRERNNIFQFPAGSKFISRTSGSPDLVSYSLETKSVYELREIATAYAQIFSNAVNKLSPV